MASTDKDDELEKRAVEEILREAAKGAVRASEVGPSGWKKGPLLKTNKRFLVNTLAQHNNSNRRQHSDYKRRRSRSPENKKRRTESLGPKSRDRKEPNHSNHRQRSEKSSNSGSSKREHKKRKERE
ncbi:protein POLR1D-like [Neocloeon triangulifer]|uniref:protein POLR1D-like n=1 Tax=Neocloeon triangulifer TaxID=2078957 RepID=UPI00286F8628|nr:protein POLR1D-like [Neocloeon triangulifer]